MKPNTSNILTVYTRGYGATYNFLGLQESSHSVKQPTLGNDHPSMGLPKPTMLSKTKTKKPARAKLIYISNHKSFIYKYMNLGMKEHFKTSDYIGCLDSKGELQSPRYDHRSHFTAIQQFPETSAS